MEFRRNLRAWILLSPSVDTEGLWLQDTNGRGVERMLDVVNTVLPTAKSQPTAGCSVEKAVLVRLLAAVGTKQHNLSAMEKAAKVFFLATTSGSCCRTLGRTVHRMLKRLAFFENEEDCTGIISCGIISSMLLGLGVDCAFRRQCPESL
jgi:hypothetical protein